MKGLHKNDSQHSDRKEENVQNNTSFRTPYQSWKWEFSVPSSNSEWYSKYYRIDNDYTRWNVKPYHAEFLSIFGTVLYWDFKMRI